MLLVSLLEELCSCYSKDENQQKRLFKVFSGYLSTVKMIPETTTHDEFKQVRLNYRLAIKKFMNTALIASQANSEERYLSLPSSGVQDQIRKAILANPSPMHYPLFTNNVHMQMPPLISRYKKDFEELERIGSGGFGSVYKVRSILDNQEYAIKKIKLKDTDKEFYEKVIREVHLLARLQHQNIVRYNTAWIDHQSSETNQRSKLPAIEYPVNTVFNRQESSSSDDFETETISNVTRTETRSCIIKDVTNEIMEDDCEINYTPNIEEDIDEGDVQITYGNRLSDIETCAYPHATSSKQSNSVLITESSTYKEEEFSVDFIEEYSGENIHSYVSKHTTSSVVNKTEIMSSSEETNGLKLCGNFGSFNVLKSEQEFNFEKSKTVRFEECRHQDKCFKSLDHCSISSTACMGARKEEKSSSRQGHHHTSEFQKSRVILYIQMELCSKTLGEWLEERNDREPMEGCDVFSIVDDFVVQNIFNQMVEGICYIHNKNLLHRDLTPKNIFLDGNEIEFHVCIGDFGLAREFIAEKHQDPVTPIGELRNQLSEVVISTSKLTTDIGTCTYASPEQLCGRTYDHKSDMYSFGVICFELHHPFKSQMEKAKCLKTLRDEGTIHTELRRRWPDESKMIEELTSLNPEMRPSADDLKKGKLFMSKDELIKCLKREIQDKDSIIEKQILEIERLKAQVLTQS
ncbi:eukaryotic translation initiation factor 2-alpha kinase 1-like isoform X2 [Antedon mediterranea]